MSHAVEVHDVAALLALYRAFISDVREVHDLKSIYFANNTGSIFMEHVLDYA